MRLVVRHTVRSALDEVTKGGGVGDCRHVQTYNYGGGSQCHELDPCVPFESSDGQGHNLQYGYYEDNPPDPRAGVPKFAHDHSLI